MIENQGIYPFVAYAEDLEALCSINRQQEPPEGDQYSIEYGIFQPHTIYYRYFQIFLPDLPNVNMQSTLASQIEVEHLNDTLARLGSGGVLLSCTNNSQGPKHRLELWFPAHITRIPQFD